MPRRGRRNLSWRLFGADRASLQSWPHSWANGPMPPDKRPRHRLLQAPYPSFVFAARQVVVVALRPAEMVLRVEISCKTMADAVAFARARAPDRRR